MGKWLFRCHKLHTYHIQAGEARGAHNHMSVVARQSMEGVILTASKLHVITLVPDGEELSFYSVAYNLIAPEKLISTSVDSVFAVMTTKEGEAPHTGMLPMVAKFGAI